MKHLFVLYEIAVMLKEKGFNKSCLAYYGGHNKKLFYMGRVNEFELETFLNTKNNNECSAPLYQQVIDWLRDSHKIHLHVWYMGQVLNSEFIEWCYELKNIQGVPNTIKNKTGFNDYYEALNKAIIEALKLI